MKKHKKDFVDKKYIIETRWQVEITRDLDHSILKILRSLF